VGVSSKGFTLLELLIGITLMALLMAALVTGLHVGVRAWEQGEARLREAHWEEERADFLARQVASLVPYELVSTDSEMQVRLPVLQATPQRLRFLSSYGSRYRNRSGLVLADYAVLETAPRKFTLALRETAVRDDARLLRQLLLRVERNPETGQNVLTYRPFPEGEDFLALMAELESVQFEYLDPGMEDSAPTWVSEWVSQPQSPYPTAIRLRWRRGSETGEELIPVRARFIRE
jgi:prepilin-type N-terminal cleavage/methylation domain-containing protein